MKKQPRLAPWPPRTSGHSFDSISAAIPILAIFLLIMVFLGGCVSISGNKRTTTTRSIDPATNTEKVVMVEEDKDFWESGNLRMYYDADGKRTDNHTAVATKKIDAIQENGRSRTYSTSTEATLGSIIDSLLIAQVKESAPPPSSAPPKTATDVFERNIVPLVDRAIGLADGLFDLDIGGPFGGSGEGNTNIEEAVVGGDLYVNSEMNGQYYLEEGSAWGAQENPSFNWHYETNQGNSTNSGQEGQASSSLPSDDDMGLF